MRIRNWGDFKREIRKMRHLSMERIMGWDQKKKPKDRMGAKKS